MQSSTEEYFEVVTLEKEVMQIHAYTDSYSGEDNEDR